MPIASIHNKIINWDSNNTIPDPKPVFTVSYTSNVRHASGNYKIAGTNGYQKLYKTSLYWVLFLLTRIHQ
jgi:hypothetical protein